MSSIKNIINILKYLSLILAMIGVVRLYENAATQGIIGIIFIITMIIYLTEKLICFIIKNSKEKDNIINNIVTILLNNYIIILAIRHYTLTGTLVYTINPLYFKINYIIISAITIILLISNYILKKEENINV